VTDSAARLDETLAALAEPHRRQVVDLLCEGPRRAGELARILQVTPSVMSRHLRVLRRSGLVEETHLDFDARVRIYSIRPQPMADLKAWLTTAEQGWAEQLTAFKEHVERPR
jgi:DNA-binding transcriptional ArsR family regulator